MPRSSKYPLGAVLRDSHRGSIIVTVRAEHFIELPPAERRPAGPFDIPFCVIEEDILLPVDRIVTCVMVVWAVTIFAGMSYLAAVL